LNRKELPKIDRKSLNRILFIRLRRIGDIVMTTPALTAVKTSIPDAKISYLIEAPYRTLLEGHPCINDLIVIPEGLRTKDFISFLREMRKHTFDAVLDLHGGPKAFWICLFTRSKIKIGYKVKYKSFIYDISVPRSYGNTKIHSVENHINLVKALGIQVPEIPLLSLPQADPSEKERVAKLLSSFNQPKNKVIVLHIGAGNRFRDWGQDNLIHLIDLFAQNPQICFILIGSHEDTERQAEIKKKVSVPVLPLSGKLNFRELKEIIQCSSLFIGPDSGPMHIAAATATPIVAFFGPTLPDHFSPWKANAKIIHKEFDCIPCKQVECIHKDYRCLQTITPEEVYIAALSYLKDI
jgi:lipopolysaccharide heptosyltransferase II